MKLIDRLILLVSMLALAACGGGSDDDTYSDRFTAGGATPTPESTPVPDPAGESPPPDSVPTPPVPAPVDIPSDGAVINSGPHNTGSGAAEERVFVYFDLDTNAALVLSTEQASANSDWDLAFSLTQVMLNRQAPEPVAAYFTNNNADFFDESGEPIAEKFYAASPESELSDFTDYLPPSTLGVDDFETDTLALFIGDRFLDYDADNQVATAADARYFVVQSDGDFSKIRATDLVNEGQTISRISLGVAHQSAEESAFAEEQALVIDAADCVGDIYIDFASMSEVDSDADWDVRLPCISRDDVAGLAFEMHIADDATAIDADQGLAGIDVNSLALYGFQANSRLQLFFDTAPWYRYNLDEEHRVWSQFGVYLVKTSVADYKFQITGYYDSEDNPGNLSFRYQLLYQ